MDTVEFFSLTRQHMELRGALDAAAARVISNGRFILGAELERFEHDFAAYSGAKYAVGVGNGLEALTLILRALRIGVGDEVIVPGHTFIATWLAVEQVGATVVPVDVDDDTYNIDPRKVKAAITALTRAIIAVHIYGQPADMHALAQISKDYQIPIVEDAAQAHGATYDGAKVGGLGIAAAFSFYPTKNLGALGDGGAVTTNDESIARSVRALRNYGSSVKYRHDELGCNSRLDELQASYLHVKLSVLETKNARRREIAARYTAGLRNMSYVKLPVVVQPAQPVWHLYVIRLMARDEMQAQLNRAGIQTMIHYPIPPHRQKAYTGRPASKIQLRCAEQAAEQVLSLPMWPELTDAEIDRVISVVVKATESSSRFPASV